MLYIIKVILSSLLPFFLECAKGGEGHPYMDGKKRKAGDGLIRLLLTLCFLSLIYVSADLLDKKEKLSNLNLVHVALKKELGVKEKRLMSIETKYEVIQKDLSKLDTSLYRRDLAYQDLNEDYLEFKDLYKRIFDEREELKLKLTEQCIPVTVPSDDTINLDDLNDRLTRPSRGN